MIPSHPWNSPRGSDLSSSCPPVADSMAREWTGYGTPEIKDSALARWTLLTSPGSNVPRRIRAQAHSCLARGWHDRAMDDPECWNIDSVYRAGSNANEAVSLGLTSPAALMAGYQIERIGFRRPETNRFTEFSTDRFEQLTELWEAVDKRTEEVNKERSKQDAKVAKAPLQYVCAAKDCGIQATKKSGLLRCAGKCPVPFKPSYCSKECQKIVCCPTFLLSISAQCLSLRRIGNGTNHSAKQTLRRRAFILSTQVARFLTIPSDGRTYRTTSALTRSKDGPQVTASTWPCERGRPSGFPPIH